MLPMFNSDKSISLLSNHAGRTFRKNSLYLYGILSQEKDFFFSEYLIKRYHLKAQSQIQCLQGHKHPYHSFVKGNIWCINLCIVFRLKYRKSYFRFSKHWRVSAHTQRFGWNLKCTQTKWLPKFLESATNLLPLSLNRMFTIAQQLATSWFFQLFDGASLDIYCIIKNNINLTLIL